MNGSDEARDPVEELAEEFIERHRRHEHPSVAEYAEAHPAWAERIRELFPALLLLEDVKSDSCSSTDGIDISAKHEETPERFGDFRILREIGRGGMGVVYEAEQVSLGRRVALKVLPPSYSSSSRTLQRFRREAQAAARLHHTNIVSVFGVGSDEGRHFYVMQYIEGPSLDRILAELMRNGWEGSPEDALRAAEKPAISDQTEDLRGAEVVRAILRGVFEPVSPRSADLAPEATRRTDASLPAPGQPTPVREHRQPPRGHTDSESLSKGLPAAGEMRSLGPAYWRSVAGVGCQVAAALHYAHRQRTLHRDIKPGNLLLDERGTVWITDFGLAKLTDQEDLTHPGDVVGTLRYMAPEQLDGKADGRTDVYSLGLTLYELLVLRPAFHETSQHRLIRQVSQQQPARPRSINRNIPRDLETIVLKAVAREPAHRYQTAGDLADDFQRFLDDRPIRARRTSALEHAWRWCRRNPALAFLTATTLILLVAGSIGSSAGYVLESGLRSEAESERQRAEANLALAAEAFEDVFSKVSGAPLRHTFEKAGDEVWIGDLGSPAMGKKDALVLEGLLKYYDRFAEQNRDSAKWQHECGQAYRRVGDIQQKFGRLREAEEAYGRALELYQRSARRAPDRVEYVVEMAAVQNQLGNTALAADRFDEAFQQYGLAQEILTRDTGAASTSPLGRFQLAEAYRAMGLAAFLQRVLSSASEGPTVDAPDAEICLRKALAILSELAEEAPWRREYRFALAECYGDLWSACRFGQGGNEAVQAKSRAIGILEDLLAEFPDNPQYRQTLAWTYAITTSFSPTGKPKDALAPLQRALALMDELPAPYAEVPEYRRTLAYISLSLAEAFFESDQDDRVEEPLQTSGELFTALKDEFPHVTRYRVGLGHSFYLRAVLQNERGQPEAARQTLERVVDVAGPAETPVSESPPLIGLLARTYTGLTDLHSQLGETALADQAAARAKELWAAQDGGPFEPPDGELRDPWGSDRRLKHPHGDAD